MKILISHTMHDLDATALVHDIHAMADDGKVKMTYGPSARWNVRVMVRNEHHSAKSPSLDKALVELWYMLHPKQLRPDPDDPRLLTTFAAPLGPLSLF